jgi:alkylated DNA repair protein (DNA oxidative demethylase)
VKSVQGLEFSSVEMHGQVARRRVTHFGWRYGYSTTKIEPAEALPDFLLTLRTQAAVLAGVEPDALAEVIVTQYPPGAPIGWHRDAPQFGDVVGVSLLGACRFKFKRGQGRNALTWETVLPPRSAYVLRGSARWAWQHSIPPVKTLRYSVTFRTLRRARRSA